MPFPLLAAALIGAGSTLGGSLLQRGSQNRQTKLAQEQMRLQNQLAQQQLGQQQRYQALLLPLVMQSLRWRNPQTLGMMRSDLESRWGGNPLQRNNPVDLRRMKYDDY